jgi:hypothetical protein
MYLAESSQRHLNYDERQTIKFSFLQAFSGYPAALESQFEFRIRVL